VSDWRIFVRDYLLHIQAAGYSDRTLEARAFWLKHAMEWCHGNGVSDPVEFTAAHAEAYRQALTGSPGRCGPRTSASAIGAMAGLRGLFAWAARYERVLFNPMADMVLRRERPEICVQISIEQMTKLLDDTDDGTLLGMRDLAVLETFYGTGIRRTELLMLRTTDLDLQARKLRVLGKGAVERFAPVGATLAAVLERYLRDCRPHLVGRDDGGALLVAANGERFSQSGLGCLMQRVSHRAGIHLSAHMLRHLFATHLLECGADFYEVQRLLGHRSPSSTQIYTHVANAVFAKKHRACHPRGRQVSSHPPPSEGDEA
jgi:integrase/recombinase XerD